MPSHTVPYIPNLKEIAPAVPELRVPETRQYETTQSKLKVVQYIHTYM